MLSFQCQFIVNKFLGSGLFLLFGFLDLWGDPRPGWLDWIGIAAVCTSILLFLWIDIRKCAVGRVLKLSLFLFRVWLQRMVIRSAGIAECKMWSVG